jgi:hypothetical protein
MIGYTVAEPPEGVSVAVYESTICVELGGVQEKVAEVLVVEELTRPFGASGSEIKVMGADWTEAPPAFLEAIRIV